VVDHKIFRLVLIRFVIMTMLMSYWANNQIRRELRTHNNQIRRELRTHNYLNWTRKTAPPMSKIFLCNSM